MYATSGTVKTKIINPPSYTRMVNAKLTKHQGQQTIDCDVHIADEMNSKSPRNHPARGKKN